MLHQAPLLTRLPAHGVPEELSDGIPGQTEKHGQDQSVFLTHHGGNRGEDADWQWKIVPFMDKNKWAN